MVGLFLSSHRTPRFLACRVTSCAGLGAGSSRPWAGFLRQVVTLFGQDSTNGGYVK